LERIFSEASTLGREMQRVLKTTLKRFGKRGVFETRKEMLQQLRSRYSPRFVKEYQGYVDAMISKTIKTIEKDVEEAPEEELPSLPALPKKKKVKAVRFKGDKPTKPKTKRKKKTLELSAKERQYFQSIDRMLSENIVTVADGGIDLMYPELAEEEIIPTSKMLTRPPTVTLEESIAAIPSISLLRSPIETNTFFHVRMQVLKMLEDIPDVILKITTQILLSYLFTNKIMYGVQYPHHVEVALNYIKNRL
jgi:hypothetical protein